MVLQGIHFDEARIADFCQKHGVKTLSLFGSILRDDFGPASDIDLLVEFLPGRTPGLFRIAGMELELIDMLGRNVDLRTAGVISLGTSAKRSSRARGCSMPRDPRDILEEDAIRLRHMLESAARARRFCAGRCREDLDSDEMLLLAMVKSI